MRPHDGHVADIAARRLLRAAGLVRVPLLPKKPDQSSGTVKSTMAAASKRLSRVAYWAV